MKSMSVHHGNIISIATGAGFAIITKLSAAPVLFQPVEFFKVFLLGFIGGVGGYFGKILVHKIVVRLKK
jgi:hypothetical protein